MPTDQHGFPQSPVTTASRDGNPVAAAGGVHSVDAVIIVVVVVVVVLLLFSPVVGIGSVATHTSAKRSIVTGAMWLHLMQQNISQSGISQPNKTFSVDCRCCMCVCGTGAVEGGFSDDRALKDDQKTSHFA